MNDKKIVFVLASYPRSGNTMVRMLLDHYFDVGSVSVYKERTDFLSSMSWCLPPLWDKGVVAIKTHETSYPVDVQDVPVLVIVRDGRDALVSYAHYKISYERNTESFAAILTDLARSPRWTEFHKYWLAQGNGVALRYEDIVRSNGSVLIDAMIKPPFSLNRCTDSPPPDGFEDYRKRTPDFFRRGVIGSWKTEMSDKIHEEFWAAHEPMMERLGYPR